MRIYSNTQDDRFAKYVMGTITTIVISGYVVGISGLYRDKEYQEKRNQKIEKLEKLTINSP